jgi:hypothetical protein
VGRLRPFELAMKYGWDVEMQHLERRLRCTACGSRRCQLVDFDPS